MSLGNQFPDHIKRQFAKRSLEIGIVLKLLVQDTTPPKIKRLIIVGRTEDHLTIASVYINSPKDKKWPEGRKSQQLLFKAENRDYLDKDSFIDCSDLKIKDNNELFGIVKNRPSAVIGKVSDEDFELIKNTIINSRTIKGKHKKKYGFYK